MIAFIVACAGVGVAGAIAGYLIGRDTGARSVAFEVEEARINSRRATAAADEAIGRLEAELAELRRDAAVTLVTTRATDRPPARATARTLGQFVSRLRGLAQIDEVVVVGRDGLLRTPSPDADLTRAAVLAANLDRLVGIVPGVVSVELTVRRGAPLSLRRLPEWTDGAWLIARGLGGRVNPLALDAAIAGAYHDQRHPGGALPVSGHVAPAGSDPRDAVLAAELGAFSSVGVVSGGRLAAYVADDGPDPAIMAEVVDGMEYLADRATYWCGEVVRVVLTDSYGQWICLAPAVRGSHLIGTGRGGSIDELAIERMRGGLRRLAPPPTDEELAS